MNTLKRILIDKDPNCKSLWFMRQAGRYLPEFRKIRAKNKNFIKLCLNSSLSSKITLQPIKRFDLDAAIIFSDILLVPYALGQNVDFDKTLGPILSSFNYKKFKKNNKKDFLKKLSPVYDAIKITRKKLNKKKSLISFVGAPWTLFVYMSGLKKSKKKISTYNFKKNNKVIACLTDYICLHIEKQIQAGANVVQIFDSWAGLIPQQHLLEYCYLPNKKIVSFCKKKRIPVICFPKGIKRKYYDFNKIVKPDGLNIDYDIDPEWAKRNLKNTSLQGGMDPKILLGSKKKILKEAKRYMDVFKNVPYIFNLGHGLLPSTDPRKLKMLINFIRKYKC